MQSEKEVSYLICLAKGKQKNGEGEEMKKYAEVKLNGKCERKIKSGKLVNAKTDE